MTYDPVNVELSPVGKFQLKELLFKKFSNVNAYISFTIIINLAEFLIRSNMYRAADNFDEKRSTRKTKFLTHFVLATFLIYHPLFINENLEFLG